MSDVPPELQRVKRADFDPDHWWGRTIRASKGRETPMGALLLAALGYTKGRPGWGSTANILPNGDVVSAYVDREGVIHPLQVVCTVDQLRQFIAGLVVECNMTDKEAEEIYQTFRSYILTDMTPGGTDFLGRIRALERGVFKQ